MGKKPKAETQEVIVAPPAPPSKAQTVTEIADIANDRLYKSILQQIGRAAGQGKYRTEWKLPWSLRRNRIPQNMARLLNRDGFCTKILMNLNDTVAIGIEITWSHR